MHRQLVIYVTLGLLFGAFLEWVYIKWQAALLVKSLEADLAASSG